MNNKRADKIKCSLIPFNRNDGKYLRAFIWLTFVFIIIRGGGGEAKVVWSGTGSFVVVSKVLRWICLLSGAVDVCVLLSGCGCFSGVCGSAGGDGVDASGS